MFNANLIFYVLIAGAFGLLVWDNNSLKQENKELSSSLEIAVNTNIELYKSFSEFKTKAQEGIDTLSRAKEKVKKEIIYVDKIKTTIIKENNGTCLDSLNNVFSRLREQESDSSK